MSKIPLFVLTCGLMLTIGLVAFADPINIEPDFVWSEADESSSSDFDVSIQTIDDGNLIGSESDRPAMPGDEDFQGPANWVANDVVVDEEDPKEALMGRLDDMQDIKVFIFWSLIIGFLPIYIYLSLVYMKLAQKIGVQPAWIAWIPIAKIYLISKMAQSHWWPMLLVFTLIVPILNVIALMILLTFNFFWHCRIFEKVGRPAWWAVTLLIPGFGSMVFLVMLSLAAWKEPTETI